jgi:hypothetical protein
MKFFKYLILFIGLLGVAGACQNRIPPQKMTALLTDFYLYGELPNSLKHPLRDSVSLSLSLLEKHRVSPEQFRATMAYYAAHPKKMQALYEGIDSLMKQRVALCQQAVEENEIARNQWKGRGQWEIDTLHVPENIPFHIPLDTVGNFTIKVTATLFADDSTQQPSMTGYFLTKTKKGVPDTVNRRSIAFTPSGSAQSYTLSFSTTDTCLHAFEGYFLQVKDDTAQRRQHIAVEKIRLLHDNDSTLYIISDIKYPKINKGDSIHPRKRKLPTKLPTKPQTEPQTKPQTKPQTVPQTKLQTKPQTVPQTAPQREKPSGKRDSLVRIRQIKETSISTEPVPMD